MPLVAALVLAIAIRSLQEPRATEASPTKPGLGGFYTNSHALVIGINRYPGVKGNHNLAFAEADADAVAGALERYYGFSADRVKVLKDKEATVDNIRRALAALSSPKRVLPDDRVIIYFAGHGQSLDLPGGGREGYLIPYDAELSDPPGPPEYLASCLPMSVVWQMLRSCPAKHVLVIADVCFSGLFTSARSFGSGEPLRSLMERPARQVITGSSNTEVSRERADLGHGVFTYKLLEELRARSKDLEAPFTTSELYA